MFQKWKRGVPILGQSLITSNAFSVARLANESIWLETQTSAANQLAEDWQHATAASFFAAVIDRVPDR